MYHHNSMQHAMSLPNVSDGQKIFAQLLVYFAKGTMQMASSK